MNAARFAFAAAFSLVTAGLSAASCAKSGPVNTGGGGGTGASGTGANGTGASGTGANGTGGGQIPAEICLLHNCASDAECAACSDGKNTCLTDEHRCVACSSGGSGGCPTGQACSAWGICADEQVTCPTQNGVPQITCAKNSDCAACDPRHQVCDLAAKKCVACTSGDTTQCQSNETCKGGDCAAKCPSKCTTDADCGQCGAAGHEAHTCVNGHCGSCSPVTGCDGAQTCNGHGTCEKPCGTTGAPKGSCVSDTDCVGCDGSATQCHIAVGASKGTCGQAAKGCSDLGNGVAVLPAPFDKVTNLCSNDADCASISADFDVGQMLADLTGWDQIHSATISYPMHACASTTITDNKSCGICVPCKTDADCAPIDVDKFAGQMFGPLGAIASAFLLDQIFGDGKHEVHMYCETIAGDYGACVPCPGVLTDCSTGGTQPDPCHDECTTGEAMDLTCGTCAAAVCLQDPYCCTGRWDNLCVHEVAEACNHVCESCSKSENGGHDKCTTGAALAPTCSTCVEAVCGALPHCCTGDAGAGTWDQACIDAIPAYCLEPAYLCKNLNQCNAPDQCTAGRGCRADYTCGPCQQNYDCRVGETCNNGTCG